MRFVLIHGGFHGAWCWERVVPALAARGHEAVAVELPGHGERRDEPSTLDGYRRAVVEVLRPGDVLVGHSMGGGVATLAADAFPEVAHVVYLAAVLPIEGRPLRTGLPSSAGQSAAPARPRPYAVSDAGTHWYYDDFEKARQALFHDCDEAVARAAFERLTPQGIAVCDEEPVHVPRFWREPPSRSFVRCTLDQAIPPAFTRSQVERLGVAPLTIATSHSPFLSRPEELADVLLAAVRTVPLAPPNPDPVEIA